MTDDTPNNQSKDQRKSSYTRLPSIEETNSGSNRTLAALVDSTPLVDPEAAVYSVAPSIPRSRRRSSLSIFQALLSSGHLLSTNDARKRNFLVGSGRQMSDTDVDEISSSFPNGRALTLMAVTWNTGEESKLYEQNYVPTDRETSRPKEEMLRDISDILLPTFIDYVSDLIIVSTQEMSVAKKRIDWEILLQEVIGPTHVLFHSLHFGTLSLCIFIRRDLIWFCTEPEEDIIKFRAVGAVRTKASLVITFNLFGTSFMIINSHFEAGEGAEGRSNRQINFQSTISKLSIPHEFVQRTGVPSNKRIIDLIKADPLRRVESTTSLDSAQNSGIDLTKSCDCVIWSGDMNFRVEMSHDKILEHCETRNYNEILHNDELHILKTKIGGSYNEFKEGHIDFPPTYKYDLRSDNNYDKHRIPSYTDRILYRDKPTSLIECTQYKSVEGVKYSDHKPVIAHFCTKLKPGLHKENLAYGKFNHEVYKRGCEQRERHHSLGVGLRNNVRPRPNLPRSSVCVLQ